MFDYNKDNKNKRKRDKIKKRLKTLKNKKI